MDVLAQQLLGTQGRWRIEGHSGLRQCLPHDLGTGEEVRQDGEGEEVKADGEVLIFNLAQGHTPRVEKRSPCDVHGQERARHGVQRGHHQDEAWRNPFDLLFCEGNMIFSVVNATGLERQVAEFISNAQLCNVPLDNIRQVFENGFVSLDDEEQS
jgi:hypothetical protein